MIKIDLLLKEHIKDLKAIVKGEGVFDRDKGEWIEGTPAEVNFKGAILPLTTKDYNQLQITQAGIFSVNDKKLYIQNQQAFLNQTKVLDVLKNETYQIYGIAKDYDIISDLKVYYIKKIDKVDG